MPEMTEAVNGNFQDPKKEAAVPNKAIVSVAYALRQAYNI